MPFPIPPSLYGCAAPQRWKREPGLERLPGRLAGRAGNPLAVWLRLACYLRAQDLGYGLLVFSKLFETSLNVQFSTKWLVSGDSLTADCWLMCFCPMHCPLL